jgi:hypothetical protein
MATASDAPDVLNLSWRRGDEFGKTIVYTEDLTGATALTTIYSLRTGAAVTTMPTVVTAGPTASSVGISLSEVPSAALLLGTYGWRQTVIAAGSVQKTRIVGRIEVTP